MSFLFELVDYRTRLYRLGN